MRIKRAKQVAMRTANLMTCHDLGGAFTTQAGFGAHENGLSWMGCSLHMAATNFCVGGSHCSKGRSIQVVHLCQ